MIGALWCRPQKGQKVKKATETQKGSGGGGGKIPPQPKLQSTVQSISLAQVVLLRDNTTK
jgi:hypothetical protein